MGTGLDNQKNSKVSKVYVASIRGDANLYFRDTIKLFPRALCVNRARQLKQAEGSEDENDVRLWWEDFYWYLVYFAFADKNIKPT